jgi:hypothetical protein
MVVIYLISCVMHNYKTHMSVFEEKVVGEILGPQRYLEITGDRKKMCNGYLHGTYSSINIFFL